MFLTFDQNRSTRCCKSPHLDGHHWLSDRDLPTSTSYRISPSSESINPPIVRNLYTGGVLALPCSFSPANLVFVSRAEVGSRFILYQLLLFSLRVPTWKSTQEIYLYRQCFFQNAWLAFACDLRLVSNPIKSVGAQGPISVSGATSSTISTLDYPSTCCEKSLYRSLVFYTIASLS